MAYEEKYNEFVELSHSENAKIKEKGIVWITLCRTKIATKNDFLGEKSRHYGVIFRYFLLNLAR